MNRKNLISITDFDKEDYHRIFERASLRKNIFTEYKDVLKDKILASIFLQPSTRTQLSFQSSFLKLGGKYIGFSDVSSSRSGPPYFESFEEMARMVSIYSDIAVLRTIDANITDEFVSGANVPVISAGSGNIDHPTQCLVDLFTINQVFGSINGSNVLIVGTPRQRTIRSLILGLSQYKNISISIICQDGIFLGQEVTAETNGLSIDYYSSWEQYFSSGKSKDVSVIYFDKIFYETKAHNDYVLTENDLTSNFSKDAIIMHPLPRTREMPKYVDNHPGSSYFLQAENGLYVRASLFLEYFGCD